jgi:hypothetical protein
MQDDKEITYDVKEKKGMSKGELEKLLLEWQKKLGMEDWKFDLKIVDFKRKNNYRQSGDFVADPEKKTASILMTWDPWRGDEEYTLVHEMLHILVYDYDKYSENLILKNHEQFGSELDLYMDKLEKLVHHLTRIFLGRSDR